MAHEPSDGRAPRDPSNPLFAPVLYEDDFAKIGQAMATTPTVGPLEFSPNDYDPKLEGERRYVEQRDRNEALARDAQGGALGHSPWERFDQPFTPSQDQRVQERAEDLRALCGGLPDSPPESMPDR